MAANNQYYKPFFHLHHEGNNIFSLNILVPTDGEMTYKTHILTKGKPAVHLDIFFEDISGQATPKIEPIPIITHPRDVTGAGETRIFIRTWDILRLDQGALGSVMCFFDHHDPLAADSSSPYLYLRKPVGATKYSLYIHLPVKNRALGPIVPHDDGMAIQSFQADIIPDQQTSYVFAQKDFEQATGTDTIMFRPVLNAVPKGKGVVAHGNADEKPFP